MDRSVLKKDGKRATESNTALAAVAFQDHLMRSMSLSLAAPLRPARNPLSIKSRSQLKRDIKPTIDTGRVKHLPKKKNGDEKIEYVLDRKPPPPTLAQKLGLVDAPSQLLSEAEWQDVKARSNNREDSAEPCVICKEVFGTQEQVLLSCSHVFHRSCLEAFERFAGKKTCPMCRKEQYQKRVIHEGAKQFRHDCAKKIQSVWRGYVVRCWYKKLRESVPPKNPSLRKKFYEDKLATITDRMVNSYDCDVNGFLRELDRELEASRDIFRHFDGVLKTITEKEWEEIQMKALFRGDSDCPICLTSLDSKGLICCAQESQSSAKNASQFRKPSSAQNKYKTRNKPAPMKGPLAKKHSETNKTVNLEKEIMTDRKKGRSQVLLSCSHVFHQTCVEAFEEFAVGDRSHLCPVCRSTYQKRVL